MAIQNKIDAFYGKILLLVIDIFDTIRKVYVKFPKIYKFMLNVKYLLFYEEAANSNN